MILGVSPLAGQNSKIEIMSGLATIRQELIVGADILGMDECRSAVKRL